MCWTAIAVLRSLKENWENSPPNWNTDDPCGDQWDGVGCTGARVTSLELSNMNLKGTLNGDIGVLAELRSFGVRNRSSKISRGTVPTEMILADTKEGDYGTDNIEVKLELQ
ncbi:hypothetical protein C5167_002159, partial [Papaver somniferum]